MNEVKTIFQLISKADGNRSPAICCTPKEFVQSCRKVYGCPPAADGSSAVVGDVDYSLLQNYFVLAIASIDETDSAVIDRRGISRFPLVSLDRFCFLIENPDEFWSDSPMPVSDGTPQRIDD